MLQKLLSAFERVVMQPYWRLTRSHTIGVQGIVIRSGAEVLLVRQSYAPGWQFPGGGVERGEYVINALERELLEEAGIAMSGAPKLHGIFGNFREFKGDHIVVFIVEHWQRVTEPRSNLEIVEQKFFPINSLPSGLHDGTRRRLAEVFESRTMSSEWVDRRN
jgi:ADP-ribose pyrophosphatase YjhB (NUDIX family)